MRDMAFRRPERQEARPVFDIEILQVDEFRCIDDRLFLLHHGIELLDHVRIMHGKKLFGYPE